MTTVGWISGRQHQIEIWYVEYNKRYYVVSERGKQAHWVQNIIHQPRVSFSIGENMLMGSGRIIEKVSEPRLAAEVSKLMAEKYKWSEGLIIELSSTM